MALPDLAPQGAVLAAHPLVKDLGHVRVLERALLGRLGAGEERRQLARHEVERARVGGGCGRGQEDLVALRGLAEEHRAERGPARQIEGPERQARPEAGESGLGVAGAEAREVGRGELEGARAAFFADHLHRQLHAGQAVEGGAEGLVAGHDLAQRARQRRRVERPLGTEREPALVGAGGQARTLGRQHAPEALLLRREAEAGQGVGQDLLRGRAAALRVLPEILAYSHVRSGFRVPPRLAARPLATVSTLSIESFTYRPPSARPLPRG